MEVFSGMDPLVLSVILSLMAAIQFGMGTLFVKVGLAYSDSFTGAFISMLTSSMLYWLGAPWALDSAYWFSPAFWIFAGIGILRPVLSTNLAYMGTAIMGPTRQATLASTAPLFAVVGGVVFLQEQISVPALLGVLGVVVGVMVLSGGRADQRDWPWLAVGFPLGAALIRSGAHVAASWGMKILPSPYFAGLLAYTVSTVVAMGTSGFRGNNKKMVFNRRGLFWFILAGVSNAGAILALNTALLYGKVVLVSPVTSSYPVFVLLFSYLFYRKESFSRRTIAGVLFIVTSVIVITVFR